jgi:hypothetical protein
MFRACLKTDKPEDFNHEETKETKKGVRYVARRRPETMKMT